MTESIFDGIQSNVSSVSDGIANFVRSLNTNETDEDEPEDEEFEEADGNQTGAQSGRDTNTAQQIRNAIEQAGRSSNATPQERAAQARNIIESGASTSSEQRNGSDRAQIAERIAQMEGRASRDRTQFIDPNRDFQQLNTGDRLFRTGRGDLLIMPTSGAPGEQNGTLFVRPDGSYDLQTPHAVSVKTGRDGSTSMSFANGDTVTFQNGRITAVQRGSQSAIAMPEGRQPRQNLDELRQMRPGIEIPNRRMPAEGANRRLSPSEPSPRSPEE
ncbi:MAG: hypothetical protein K2Z81_12825 [Cyanobacteria bacterium]|nr:hypothetical protein [Cyanobacteriota bacterium]